MHALNKQLSHETLHSSLHQQKQCTAVLASESSVGTEINTDLSYPASPHSTSAEAAPAAPLNAFPARALGPHVARFAGSRSLASSNSSNHGMLGSSANSTSSSRWGSGCSNNSVTNSSCRLLRCDTQSGNQQQGADSAHQSGTPKRNSGAGALSRAGTSECLQKELTVSPGAAAAAVAHGQEDAEVAAITSSFGAKDQRHTEMLLSSSEARHACMQRQQLMHTTAGRTSAPPRFQVESSSNCCQGAADSWQRCPSAFAPRLCDLEKFNATGSSYSDNASSSSWQQQQQRIAQDVQHARQMQSGLPARVQINRALKQQLVGERASSPHLLPYTSDRSAMLLSAVPDSCGNLDLDPPITCLTFHDVAAAAGAAFASCGLIVNGLDGICSADVGTVGQSEQAAAINSPPVVVVPGSSLHTSCQPPHRNRGQLCSPAIEQTATAGAQSSFHTAREAAAAAGRLPAGLTVSTFESYDLSPAASPHQHYSPGGWGSRLGVGLVGVGGESGGRAVFRAHSRGNSPSRSRVPGATEPTEAAGADGGHGYTFSAHKHSPLAAAATQQHSAANAAVATSAAIPGSFRRSGSSPPASFKQPCGSTSISSNRLSRSLSKSTSKAASAGKSGGSAGRSSSSSECERGAGVKGLEPLTPMMSPLELDPSAPPLHNHKLSQPDLSDVDYIVNRWSHRWQSDRIRSASSTAPPSSVTPVSAAAGSAKPHSRFRDAAASPPTTSPGGSSRPGSGGSCPSWLRPLEQLHLFGASPVDGVPQCRRLPQSTTTF